MRLPALLALACALAIVASPAQKKKKEEETQTLQLPRELPPFTTGETRRLAFHVTPLSSKGLLSQQIRDALKALSRDAGSNTVLKIRAFVAGSGDLRRVRDLVSETFTDRRQPLPALSLVQAGGLPMEGAQVILEGISAAKKDVNPDGLVFISSQIAASQDPLDPVPPLTTKSLASLRQAVKAAGSEPADVLRVSCFFSSLENLAASRDMVVAEYPRAALNFVQTRRAPDGGLAACEAVARLRWKTGTRIHLLNPEGLSGESGFSQVALVSSPRVVLTASQNSFGLEEKDARLAFGRMQKTLEQAGVSMRDAAFTHYYPLSLGIARMVHAVHRDSFAQPHAPAGSMLVFEGLPSMDAGFALDIVAAKD